MDDDNSHSDIEFYYPDKENHRNEENVGETTLESVQTQNDVAEILSEAQKFIEGQRPENTKKKTEYDMNVWKRYLQSCKETRNTEDIPDKEFNALMCRFFMEIKKKDGEQYEPVSLTSFQRSLQRYLNDKGSTTNILKDNQFSKSREVLQSRKRQLVHEFGKGNRPRAARPLTNEEEDLLFQNGEFGDHCPESVQRSVWWLLSLQFGFRARDESRKLKWGDVELHVDGETGHEGLVWLTERGSKCRSSDGARAFTPKAQATNNERYPVKFYKAFKNHRPDEMNVADAPFYLAVNHKRKPQDEVWYMKLALGKNSIGSFLKPAAK